ARRSSRRESGPRARARWRRAASVWRATHASYRSSSKKIPAGRSADRTCEEGCAIRKLARNYHSPGGASRRGPGPCEWRKRVLDSQFHSTREHAMSNEQRTVNIEIGDKEWEGVYANFVIITHSGSEFVLDFARMLPGAQKAKVFSRIITTPQHAKALLGTL